MNIFIMRLDPLPEHYPTPHGLKASLRRDMGAIFLGCSYSNRRSTRNKPSKDDGDDDIKIVGVDKKRTLEDHEVVIMRLPVEYER
jgi:hypothetical protein